MVKNKFMHELSQTLFGNMSKQEKPNFIKEAFLAKKQEIL
jgi:hypothetical protein